MAEVDWEKLCELDAERTQGEWFYYPVAPARGAGTTEFDFKYGDSISGLSSRTPAGDRHITEFGEASPQKDARFIAALANAFPAIKAERDAKDATIRALQEENEGLREALTPSGATKAVYSGEIGFYVDNPADDEDDIHVLVPWTVIKEIMSMIAARAALKDTPND